MKFAKRPEVVIIDIPGGITDIIESICKFFCEVEKRVPIVDAGAGGALRIFFFALSAFVFAVESFLVARSHT